MPAPLNVELLALEARAAGSGVGDAVDIGTLRKVSTVTIDFQDFAASEPELIVSIETSSNGTSGWKIVGEIALDEPTEKEIFVWNLSRYIRATWTVGGSATSISFAVTGVSSVVYPGKTDIPLSAKVIDSGRVSEEDIWREMLSASEDADGYLSERYHLPLAKWGGDLKRYTGYIVVYRLMCGSVGFQPDGADYHFDKNHDLAFKWLKDVSNGVTTPAGIVDSTPEVTSNKRWAVASGPRQADDDICY